MKDWCWNSNILATWWEELTHLKRPWCWERLRAGGEGDDRGWDGWMVSPTQWTWVWVESSSWWWTGRPGMLRFIGSQRIGHDWVTELNWSSIILVLNIHTYPGVWLENDFLYGIDIWTNKSVSLLCPLYNKMPWILRQECLRQKMLNKMANKGL